MKTGPKPRALKERLLAHIKVDQDRGCWNWQGTTNGSGYGMIGIGSRSDGSRKKINASRAAWIAFRGEDPAALFVCHKCDNPQCCNPDHLFLGTQKDNMADASLKGRCRNPFQAGKTECPQGHKYDLFGTRNGKPTRSCIRCQRERVQRYYYRNQENILAKKREQSCVSVRRA